MWSAEYKEQRVEHGSICCGVKGSYGNWNDEKVWLKND